MGRQGVRNIYLNNLERTLQVCPARPTCGGIGAQTRQSLPLGRPCLSNLAQLKCVSKRKRKRRFQNTTNTQLKRQAELQNTIKTQIRLRTTKARNCRQHAIKTQTQNAIKTQTLKTQTQLNRNAIERQTQNEERKRTERNR